MVSEKTRVIDLMVPLDEYALVPEDATLIDAVLALEKAQKRLPPGRQPHRAVLVIGREKEIVGKIDQLAFLKAMEPKYDINSDKEHLRAAGVRTDDLESMMEHSRFFQDDLFVLCQQARNVKVKDAMRPVTESIDADAPLGEVMHRIISEQTLSIIVTRDDQVVGLLRLSDLLDEIRRQMKELSA